jgi:hypothetical protein
MKKRLFNALVLTILELMMFVFQVFCWFWIFKIANTHDFTKGIIIFCAVLGIVMSFNIKKIVEKNLII